MVKKYRLKYQTTYVTVDDPRQGICHACGKTIRSGDIKTTQCHHYRYAYKPKTVRKHPEKAVENILELCFYDHQIADALRVIHNADNARVVDVVKAHPRWFRKELVNLAKQIIFEEKEGLNREKDT